MLPLALRSLAFIAGLAVVLVTLRAAIRQFVMPRAAPERLTRAVFVSTRVLFNVRVRRARDYARIDRIMAMYAPVTLLCLPAVWLTLITAGYTAMFWALGAGPWHTAFNISGSSVLTLGFATADGTLFSILSFTEATLGLVLVALLISYLPTMYAAFARREAAVTMLEVRAGSPPSISEMMRRYQRIHGLNQLTDLWRTWESWFADVEESHTSLAALAFFRSPQPDRSWITAAGAILDAASFTTSTLDIPRDPQADLCIRAGFLALRHIADFFQVPYNPHPSPTDPISIVREEYDAVCAELDAAGIPLKPDRDQTWRDFSGWRVNYDTVLLALCALTLPPYAPWSSDRGLARSAIRLPAGK